jgi:hypothetical protein
MQRVLALERSPGPALSLRFFFSAPLFAMLAALALWWQGAPAFSSRWSNAVLAATHLFTLGVLTMTMIGALMQLLPVVAGVELSWRRRSVIAVHALLCAGTALLAAAFWLAQPMLFALAVTPLVLAVSWILWVFGAGLWQARKQREAGIAGRIRMALGALLPTVLLGAAMAAAFAWPVALPLATLTDLHVLWGLPGWIGLLLIAVAYQVIPMFQVTPLYPPALTRHLGRSLLALLLAISAAQLAWHPGLAVLRILLLAGFALFAGVTLVLLARRKRPAPDPTTWFWRLSMASLLAAAVMWFAPIDASARALLLGVLFLPGFAWSAVSGMLYKIVPFLLWQHWQEQSFDRPVPSIRLVIPARRALIQFWCHAVALVLLAGAALWPGALLRAAAAALLGSALLLGLNLVRAWRLQP